MLIHHRDAPTMCALLAPQKTLIYHDKARRYPPKRWSETPTVETPDPPPEEEGAIPQRETRTLRSSPSKEATQFAGCEESRKEVTGWLAAKANGLSQKNWLASSSINTANELTKKRTSAKRVLPDADAGLSQPRGRSRRKR